MQNYKIIGDIKLGRNVLIEEYVIIGIVPEETKNDMVTSIGDDSIVRSHSTIYAGNRIGKRFRTGHGTRIREFNHIGNNVSVGTNSVIEHHVIIEDDVRIHSQVFIPEYCIIKRGAWIGPRAVLTNAKYPRYQGVKDNLEGVVIEENAKIGANSTILPGIRIGKNALVGAGSVVTGDVEENTIVVGNPARFLKHSDEIAYEVKK